MGFRYQIYNWTDKAIVECLWEGLSGNSMRDLVGIEEKTHRFYGVSEFKRSFGCEELKYTPAHDLVLRPSRYLITKAVEKTRKKIRHV